MSIQDFEFQLKGPEAIRSRMEELRARLQGPKKEEFQKQLEKVNKGTPAPLQGSIGDMGDEKLGPLPPANPAEFEVLKGSIGPQGKQADKVQIQGLIAQVAREQNIDSMMLRAVVEAESDYNQNEVSKTGAMGLMQLMPGTAKELGVVDAFNPYENLTGGAKYLNQMLKRYNGNIELALSAYNAGPGKVDKAKGIPNIPETQQYVNRIMTQLGKR
jgi:hypothetical protein